jgi:hypothetical protein
MPPHVRLAADGGRYVKLLPQPGEDDAADRLNAYLRRAEQQSP